MTSNTTSSASNSIQSCTTYSELSVAQLKELLTIVDTSNRADNKAIVIKFGATWCQPCQTIKPLCNKYFNNLPSNIICFDLDVDENMELYIAYKAKKMVTSIPTILAYINNYERDKEHWYAPDLSVIGSETAGIEQFFKIIKTLK